MEKRGHTSACVCLLVAAVAVASLLGGSEAAMSSETTTVITEYRTRLIDGLMYNSYAFYGQGPHWKQIEGEVMGLVIPEGIDFDVLYQNHLNEETIVHAHGLTPPSTVDGVPYLSALPLYANRTAHYQYTLDRNRNNGTYFIHSHYGFQSGNGLVAPVIIKGSDPSYPLANEISGSTDVVMLLEDVCPSASEEFLAKKEAQGSTPIGQFASDSGQSGDCSSWKTFLELAVSFNETNSEPPVVCPNVEAATGSDVGYKAYLANGATSNAPVFVMHDQTDDFIMLRVINACGMTNMRVDLPFTATLTAVDGQLVEPYQTDSVWLSVAQRADILIDVAEAIPYIMTTNGVQWFAAIAYTESTSVSVPCPLVIVLSDYLDNTTRSQITSTIQSYSVVTGMMTADLEMNIHAFTPLVTYDGQRQISFTAKLTGDNGFKGINSQSYRLPPTQPLPFQPNPNPFLVQYGDWVEIDIENNNPDGHPMHLHGHHFQILRIDGEEISGAVRDVVLVPGGCHNITIGFTADNPGIWAFHCHLEFHLAAGMLTTVEYRPSELASSSPPPADSSSIDIWERCDYCSSGECQKTTVFTNKCIAFESCSGLTQHVMVKASQASGNFFVSIFEDSLCTVLLQSVDLRCNKCAVQAPVCNPMFLSC